MSPETYPNQENQPELPFPEPIPERESQITDEAVNESTVVFSGLKEWAGAWRNHLKQRLSRPEASVPQYEQPELPFAEVGVQDNSGVEQNTDDQSSFRVFVKGWKNRLQTKITTDAQFREALTESYRDKVASRTPTGDRAVPQTRAQRRAELKAERALYKHARAKEEARWKDAVHGTQKGTVSRSETRAARKAVMKEARELHKAGVIDAAGVMKMANDAAGIMKYKENSVQKRARRRVEHTAEKVHKKTRQSRVGGFIGARLMEQARLDVSADSPVESSAAASGHLKNTTVPLEELTPVPVTVHTRDKLFPKEKAKSFVFDKRGSLKESITGPIPVKKTIERDETSSRKRKEVRIPKEIQHLFEPDILEAAYDRIQVDINTGIQAKLAEYNEGKSEDEQLSDLSREEKGEVITAARKKEIESLLEDNYSDTSADLLLRAWEAIHKKRESAKKARRSSSR